MQDKGRVLALDIGTVRVGAAISDPSRIIAQGLGVWQAEKWTEDFRACLEKYNPTLVIVGLPKHTDGTQGAACRHVLEVLETLRSEYPKLDFQTWDERFTTVIAQRVLIEADVSRKRRKKSVDKLAAVLILEDWLEAHKTSSNPVPAEAFHN